MVPWVSLKRKSTVFRLSQFSIGLQIGTTTDQTKGAESKDETNDSTGGGTLLFFQVVKMAKLDFYLGSGRIVILSNLPFIPAHDVAFMRNTSH